MVHHVWQTCEHVGHQSEVATEITPYRFQTTHSHMGFELGTLGRRQPYPVLMVRTGVAQ